MNIIGIICEYNPFHNGHLYHINKIKKLYPSSLIILVLNGYFMQRGEISVLTKKEKTKIALENKVDLVVEHPFVFSSNSADIFADSAVEILSHLNCEKIIFGSESNNINLIKNAAKKQLEENFNEKMKKNLKKGLSYPAAINTTIGLDITTPNDLLGISYVKSILQHNYNIKPLTIKRTNEFHDVLTSDPIVSASNIRKKHKENQCVKKYTNYSHLIKKIDETLYFNLLKHKINTEHNLNKYLTVDEGIEYRLLKYINNSNNIKDFIEKVKTKRYTYNRINRMLIHILIGLKKEDKNKLKLEYIKVLGFNEKGQNHLKKLKNKEILISSKITNNYLSRQYELKASLIYDLLTNEKTINFENNNKPIKKI